MSSSSRWGLALLMLASGCAESPGIGEDGGVVDVDADTPDDVAPTVDTTDAWMGDAGPCADRDDDGVCDAVDVCPDVSDPAQIDPDHDGVGWLCDTVEELGMNGSGALTAFRGDHFVMLTQELPAGVAYIGPDYAFLDRNFGNSVSWANRVDALALDAEGRAYFFVRGAPSSRSAIYRMSPTGIETLSAAAFIGTGSKGWQVINGPAARFIVGVDRTGQEVFFSVDAMADRFLGNGAITDITNPSYAYVRSWMGDVFALTDHIERVSFPPTSTPRTMWGGDLRFTHVPGPVFGCSDTGDYYLHDNTAIQLGLTARCRNPIASWPGGFVGESGGELAEVGVGSERILGMVVGSLPEPWFATATGVSRLDGHGLVSYWEREVGTGPFTADAAWGAMAAVQRGDSGPWSLHVRGARSYDLSLDPEFRYVTVGPHGNAVLARGTDLFATSGEAPIPIGFRSPINRTPGGLMSSSEVLMADRWVSLGMNYSVEVGLDAYTGASDTQCSVFRVDERPDVGPRVDLATVSQPCTVGTGADPTSARAPREIVAWLDGTETAVVVLRVEGNSEAFTLAHPYVTKRAAVDPNWMCELPGEVRCWPHADTTGFTVIAESTERNEFGIILTGPRGLAVLRHIGASVPPPGRRVLMP